MEKRTQAYHRAVEIEIAACERGEGPDTWDACPWADEVRYVPAEAEAREASQLFGELEDDLDVAEFEAWLDGLRSERFREVSKAIDVLRRALAEYRSDLDVRDLADWID
jgi:hypothetical protein